MNQILRESAIKVITYEGADVNIVETVRRIIRGRREHGIICVLLDLDAYSNDEYKRVRIAAQSRGYNIFGIYECFELWILAHFEKINKSVLHYDTIERKLNKHLATSYRKNDVKLINKIVEDYSLALENISDIGEYQYEMHNSFNYTNMGELFSYF